jgi:hypothetical protein
MRKAKINEGVSDCFDNFWRPVQNADLLHSSSAVTEVTCITKSPLRADPVNHL